MAYKRFKMGDYFFVPLEDGSNALGQVIADELIMNSVQCAFWPQAKSHVDSMLTTQPICVAIVTRELLRSGVWPINGNASVSIPMHMRQYEMYRELDWVGLKIHGAGIIRRFLNMCNGLEPWDGWPGDPGYSYTLLAPGAEKPSAAWLACP